MKESITNLVNVVKDVNEREKMTHDLVMKLGDEHQIDYVEVIQSPVEIYNVELKKTKKFKIDTGAPKSVAGEEWIRQYCNDKSIDFDALIKKQTSDVFILGNQKFRTLGRVDIPVGLETVKDEMVELKVSVHMIQKPIEMLVGMNTLRAWRVVLDPESQEIGLKGEGRKIKEYLKAAFVGHFVVPLWGIDPSVIEREARQKTYFVDVITKENGRLEEVRHIMEKCRKDLNDCGVEVDMKIEQEIVEDRKVE